MPTLLRNILLHYPNALQLVPHPDFDFLGLASSGVGLCWPQRFPFSIKQCTG
ncbi:hypothetical protein N431DRAFT_435189 [Stipitochalara longipes BDJ]|nr:hypothetical protein N431DRAFT_435189 [Stipitochalara longipes BDJ]